MPIVVVDFTLWPSDSIRGSCLPGDLHSRPPILLLDELTANLDVKHQLEVTRMLKDISVRKGILIIMICHDLNIAAKYSDRIIMLKDGNVYATGTVNEVITEDNICEVYGVGCRIIEDNGRPL